MEGEGGVKDEQKFTDSQVDGFSGDNHPEFEADDQFLSVPTDESGKDDDANFNESSTRSDLLYQTT